MPRNRPSRTSNSAVKTGHRSVLDFVRAEDTSHTGKRNYTEGQSSLSTDELYRELDGAVAVQHGTAWRLSITAIHEAGGERWVQVSVTANSLQHDLVVQMADTARASDAFASIESWLGHPAPGTRIIYVS